MAIRVSRVVRLLMALADESQSDVAKVIGVPQSAVSARLRGQTKWTVDDLEVLAEHYGKPITVFFIDPDDLLSPRERRSTGVTERFSYSSGVTRVTTGSPRTPLHRPARIPAGIL